MRCLKARKIQREENNETNFTFSQKKYGNKKYVLYMEKGTFCLYTFQWKEMKIFQLQE